MSQIAQVNGTGNAGQQFTVSPTAEQRLEAKMQEEVSFLQRINVSPVRQQKGNLLGLGINSRVGGRRSAANLPRQPRYIGAMDGRSYELETELFDTMIPWNILDTWAEFPNFGKLYADAVARAIGLDRICVGWHGVEAADDTDLEEHPNLEDFNIGWLQKLRLERPDHVMGRALSGGTATGAAQPIHIHADAAYKNVDALAYDLIAGMPSWARTSTELVVIVGQDLVDEKYFPMVNRPLSTTIDGGKSTSDEAVRDIVVSAKQIGGRPAAIVPFFPEGTMAITPLKNLSIYYQAGGRRRFIREEPEMMRGMVDYQSSNEAYVIESTDHMVMAENITFTAP
ncbi:MAG: phage major capsid protein, P2 family [Sphingomonadales bacterium 63-6]|nr:MAG: phage major capsid protein, P2 family [Sphingomonadales bacterium 63-6]